MTTTSDITAVADALRANERFIVTSHENPDGDALGSLLAMHLALVELGKDSVMVLVGDSPLPAEYGFLDVVGAGLLRAVTDDHADRVLVAVDSAQETRLTDARLSSSTLPWSSTSIITTTTPGSGTSTSWPTARRRPPRCR